MTYDFQELKVAEYSNEKKASVTIEVYRQRTPTYAFGIYSQERLSNANFVIFGTQGYIEENVLNFMAGPYYVKISGSNTGHEDREILLTFAKKVAENLGGEGDASFDFILLPSRKRGQKRNSEKFIPIKFLGYAFLHSAFTADYEASGTKFKLFVRGWGKDCKDMIQKYLQQTRNPAKDVVEGRYVLSDPYNGEIDLRWKGRNIWGIVSLNDPEPPIKIPQAF